MKPRIFIGSSVEGLSVAYAIQQNLTHDAEATVWNQGVFELSKTTMESLNSILDSVDFGIFVFSPDDMTIMRGNESLTIRDNVLFEFGLFIGKLGRNRVFFIIPEGSDIHIPTDLFGVTPGKYDSNRTDKSLQAATGAACNQMRTQFKNLGTIRCFNEHEEADKSNNDDYDADSEWLSDLIEDKFDSAKTKLEIVISKKSGDELLTAKVWRAYINFKTNEKNGFRELCNLAETYEDNIAIQKLIPIMLAWENYNGKAIELINNALVKHPLNSELIVLLANCYKNNGNLNKAVNILSGDFSLDSPEIAIALSDNYEKTNQPDKAITIIHEAYVNFPNELITHKYASLLQQKYRNKEALYLLNTLVNRYPKNILYWGELSNCCLELDLYDEAMTACKTADELSESKEAWILCNIGNMLNNKGFYTDAISWLNKGLDLNRSYQYAHDRLAKAIKNKEEEHKKYQDYCAEGCELIQSVRELTQENVVAIL